MYGFYVSPPGTFKTFFRVTSNLNNKTLWVVPMIIVTSSKLIFIVIPELIGRHSIDINSDELASWIQLGPIWILPIVLFGSIVAPLFEEILFRGYAFNAFLLKPGKRAQYIGMLVTSILFAFSHDLAWIDKFFSGLAYSKLRVQQGSLIGVAAIHSLINFISLLLIWAMLANLISYS